ncbi:MAG: SLBB domain-containing protein [Armatimonadetes bacterium]|nr:SLBB domain-containing protein [Armatimonadota bacterium]
MRTISFWRGMLGIAVALLVAPVIAHADGSRLAVGDVISVVVDGEADLSKNYQINDEGGISMPLVGVVKVTGINTTESAAVITKTLANVLVNPQVTVTFVQRARMQVFVVGQVQKTGLFEIGVGDRVIQALAQSGYDDTADLSRVNIRRGNEIIELDLTQYLSGKNLEMNATLKSGDTVVVPRVDMIGSVLVLGQVNKVGTYPIRRGTTFREMMGLIGGATVEADTDKITVKRADSPEPVHIEYKKAMDGDPSADMALQPGDTIYVPQIETAFYTVMGGVNRPGQFPLKGKLTLMEAIGEAGGAIPNLGDLRKVQLVRASGTGPESGKTTNINLDKMMKTNPTEQPIVMRGDVVYVAVHKDKPNLWHIFQSLTPLAWLLR